MQHSLTPHSTNEREVILSSSTLTVTEPKEEEIRENLLEYETQIQKSLCPTKLFRFCRQLKIKGCVKNNPEEQEERSKNIIQEVLKQEKCSMFLKSLTEDTEHMGHRYIASLLTGKKFAQDDEIKESKRLLEKILQTSDTEDLLNVDAIIPHLFKNKLVTKEEIQILRRQYFTLEEKVRYLLTLLETKGPIAHFIFVRYCLAAEDTHYSHTELYHILTTQDSITLSKTREGRKRKAISNEEPANKVTKRNPSFLDGPDDLKTEQYLLDVRNMRKYHLSGRQYWDEAEQIYRQVMSSPDHSKEMQIAIILESCTMHITDKQSRVVEERVTMARCFCEQLYAKHSSNVDILVARCDWVQAKLYRYTKEYDKALDKIKSAMYNSYQYNEGEERALIEYCHACILLGKEDRTPREEERAIKSLNIAISCANSGEFGLDISHCILRLAQAHVGSSTGNTGKKRGEVSEQNIDEAKRVLGDIKEKNLSPRTRCMLLYTRSDVYRVAGELEQAAKCAEESLQIAQQHNFQTEIASAELRVKRLKNE